MNRKFRLWVQHGHINDVTLRCDLREYHYWSAEGRKTTNTRLCVCNRCKEYRASLKEDMLKRIKKHGASAVLNDIGKSNGAGAGRQRHDNAGNGESVTVQERQIDSAIRGAAREGTELPEEDGAGGDGSIWDAIDAA